MSAHVPLIVLYVFVIQLIVFSSMFVACPSMFFEFFFVLRICVRCLLLSVILRLICFVFCNEFLFLSLSRNNEIPFSKRFCLFAFLFFHFSKATTTKKQEQSITSKRGRTNHQPPPPHGLVLPSPSPCARFAGTHGSVLNRHTQTF